MITWTTLSEVILPLTKRSPLQQGWSPQCEARPAEPNDWGVLKTTAIQSGRFDDSANKRLPEALQAKPELEVSTGDLLVTCAGPRTRCGVPAMVRRTRSRLMISGKMYRFRARDELDPRFLELYLLSSQAQRLIDGMKTGISESGLNLTKERFLKLPVPIASLDEQRRVIEILEDHLPRLDAGENHLDSVERRLSLLRGSLLEAMLPRQVPIVALKELADTSGYGTSAKCVVGGPGTPVVRIPNLIDGSVDLTDEKRVADPTIDVSGHTLSAGDLLFVRTNGSKYLIGKTAVVQEGINASFASYLIRYQLNSSAVDPRWVHLMMQRQAARRKIESLAASSAGQYNLSLGKLDSLCLPVPELAVQHSLISRFASADAVLKRTRLEVTRLRRRIASLRRSLLAAAFRGHLTGTGTDIDQVVEGDATEQEANAE